MRPVRLLAALTVVTWLSACNWLAPEPSVFEVQLYPQPIDNIATLSFRLDRSADVVFRIYASPLPPEISDPELYAQRLDAGQYLINIDFSDFPRGLYEADLLVDGAPYRLQLVIIN